MKLPALAVIAALTSVGGMCARADEIRTVPFSFASSPTGSIQETTSVPQFDPANGTLNSVTLTFSESFQFVFEDFNTGAGALSVTGQDALTFGGIPVPVEGAFSTTIPANQLIFAFTPLPVSSGVLTENLGSSANTLFTGTGTVPFTLSIPPPTVVQFSGSTTTSLLIFGGPSGTVTADYAFTPTPNAAPEPGTLGIAGLALIGIGAFRRRRSPTILD